MELELAEVLDTIDAGVVVQDREAFIIYASRRAEELFGPSLVGTSARDPMWEVVTLDGRPVTAEARPVARVLATRAEVRGVIGVRRGQGERRWVEVCAAPRFAPSGEVEHVVLTLHDVSEHERRVRTLAEHETEAREGRVHAERALAESELLYASVLRSMAEGFVIHASSGAIRFVNPAAERILGLSFEQLTGRAAIDQRWQLVRADGTPLPPEEIPSEITSRTGRPCERAPIGVIRHGERAWLQVSTDPVGERAADGRYSVVATFTDVTAERTAQLALERSRAELADVIEAVPGVLYRLEQRGDEPPRVTFMSARASELLAMPNVAELPRVEELVARIHPDDRERIGESWRAAARAGTCWAFDLRYSDAQGGWRWLRTRAVAGQGGVWTGVLLDVTEERQLAEQVRAAQRREAIGSVTAGVAHNFNNALAVVVPAIEEALPEAKGAARGALEDARGAALGAADLVRQLMRISRARTAEPREAVDLAEVVREVVSLCRRIFPRAIAIDLRVETPSTVVLGRRAELHQLVLNLAINARDALAERSDPRLAITLRQSVEHTQPGSRAAALLLEVSDNGVGMSEDVVAHLGEPFFTRRPGGMGSGLGLATAFASVREMGGRIECFSVPGGGTTFLVSLPLLEAAPEPARRTPSPSARPRAGRVLVVDDDRAVRQTLSRLLEAHGWQVEQADGGARALERLRAEPGAFSVMLLDLSMSGLSGEEVLQRAKTIAPSLPIVVLSGYVESSDAVAGASLVLGKPVTSSALTEALERALGS